MALFVDPLVTVLIPVHDGERFVGAAVSSALAQTYPNVEVVVVDDGSTDRTPTILAEAAGRDDRVRVVTRSTNGGIVAALNDGLAVAMGVYIARLDADDECRPTRLRTQVDVLVPSDHLLTASAYRSVSSGRLVDDDRVPPQTHAALAGAMLCGNSIAHSTVMFRRDAAIAVGGYRASWFPVEDYDLWLRLMHRGTYAGVRTSEVARLDNPVGISASRAVEQTERHIERVRSEWDRLGTHWSSTQDGAVLVGAATGGGGRDARRLTRRLAKAVRLLRRDLRGRGISTTGIDAGPLRAATRAHAGSSRWSRQVSICFAAPRLWICGHRDLRSERQDAGRRAAA